jgi:hypothetical protein
MLSWCVFFMFSLPFSPSCTHTHTQRMKEKRALQALANPQDATNFIKQKYGIQDLIHPKRSKRPIGQYNNAGVCVCVCVCVCVEGGGGGLHAYSYKYARFCVCV